MMSCVLETLRDRTINEVSVGWNLGAATASTLGRLAGDDTIYIMRSGYLNGDGPWADDPDECTLKDAAYFQACLDVFDLNCLDPDNWTTQCTVNIGYCR